MATVGADWTYANNWRISAVFLGLTIVFLGVGVLVVVAVGNEAAFAAGMLLTVATFLLVFSLLVFLPRLAHRGAVSFSLLSRRSMEEAETAVSDVITESGQTPHVKVVKSRSEHPPRIVSAPGISVRFRLEATRHAPGTSEVGEWTEIVQTVSLGEAKEAAALRERIAARLAGATAPKD